MKNMFTNITKSSFIIAILVVLSFTAKASEGIKPNLYLNSMELSVVNSNTIQIKTSLFTSNNESYEIEKSYDNKNFKTVAMVFAFEKNEFSQSFQLKDKISKGNKKVYYRIKKVVNETVTYVMTQKIAVK
jgi:antitoxin component YwqK of YwqJK toxin-antitoxin module